MKKKQTKKTGARTEPWRRGRIREGKGKEAHELVQKEKEEQEGSLGEKIDEGRELQVGRR